MPNYNPKCYKDTFWNIERVRRDLKFKHIANRYDRNPDVVAGWFSGFRTPSYDIMVDLVKWFNELDPDHTINTTYGIQEFEMAHERWVALNKKELKMKGTDQDTNKDIRCGRQPKSRIAFLIRSRGLTQKELAEKLDMKITTLQSYLRGQTKATTDLIIELSDILDNTPENIEEMLTEIYNENHTDPKQITTDDIQMGGFTADIPVTHEVTDQDITEMFPSKELTVDHTMDGPVVITDPDGSVFDYASKPYYEYPSKEESDNTYSGGERFTKWFNLFNTILEDRKDIVAHLMYLYTEWDYNMYATIEALVYERNDIPFWVLRSIIIESEKVKYYGERNVTE